MHVLFAQAGDPRICHQRFIGAQDIPKIGPGFCQATQSQEKMNVIGHDNKFTQDSPWIAACQILPFPQQ